MWWLSVYLPFARLFPCTILQSHQQCILSAEGFNFSTSSPTFVIIFLSLSLSFFLATPHSMQNLPRPGIKPAPTAVEAQCLNHRTSEEVHICLFQSCLVGVTEKAMAPHSSTLAWKIPWMEEPGRLQSMGSLRVRHDWATSLSLFTFKHWRRKWQPTPVFLPGESQGRGSLVGCRLWGRTESDTTEAT